MTTDGDGLYAWDVPEGLWQVRAEKDGYETYVSNWMEVPPPRTDIKISLISKDAPSLESVSASGVSVVLRFSQYMDVESVISAVSIGLNGNEVVASIDASDEEAARTGLSKAFTLTLTSPLKSSDSISLRLDNARSYNGKTLTTSLENISPVLQPEELLVPKNSTIERHTDAVLNCAILPAGCSIGNIVSVASSDESILRVEPATVSDDGAIVVSAHAGISGTAYVTISVDGTQLKDTFAVTVGDKTAGLSATMPEVSTVSFDSNGGSEVSVLLVRSGSYAAAPVAPTFAGKTFEGWYEDGGLTKAFDFSEPIVCELSLSG